MTTQCSSKIQKQNTENISLMVNGGLVFLFSGQTDGEGWFVDSWDGCIAGWLFD